MEKSTRQNRVSSEARKVLSEYLLRCSIVDNEKINPAFISITDVEVSPCLQHMKIFVVSLSKDYSNKDCVEYLTRHSPCLRYHIGTKIRLKFTPDLTFFVDNSFDYAEKIETLLKKINC